MFIIIPILIAVLGWISGVAINYFSDVLPRSRNLSHPHCWNCDEKTEWKRYIFTWNQCQYCQKRRKKRAWFVEILALLVTLWLWYSPPEKLGFLAGLLILIYFASVVIMDIEHRVILHSVSIVGALLMTGFGVWQHGFSQTITGGLAGFGIMFGLYYLGDIFARWMAKRRNQEFEDVALGFGDVNLAGVIGLLMGWPGIAGGLIVGISAGGVYSFFYILYKLITRSYSAFSTIPYGPFLIFGAVFLVYLRDYLIII